VVGPLDTAAKSGFRAGLAELRRLDVAVYAAVASASTPTLDAAFRRLSRAADHSKLWLGTSALLCVAGGSEGRRATRYGLASIALASTVVNAVMKPLSNRRRPDRDSHSVPAARHVKMPRSTSWPSGHSASAFAFATGVAIASPALGIPLNAVAALVAYSRVHTGVHYPVDVVAGAVTGVAAAPLAVAAVERRSEPR
jgi:membrane-associated phospholipid phosphatase